MTTIAKLLLGLSKKGINPQIIEHSGKELCENYMKISWKQAEKEISVFFDKLTGAYKGYARSSKSGDVKNVVSVKHLAQEPNFRKYEIARKQMAYDDGCYVNVANRNAKQIVTTSIDPKANVFTVLKQTPSDTQVSSYHSMQIFPLYHA